MIHLRLREEPTVRLQVKDDIYRIATKVAYEANVPIESFDGAYEYTPTREAQVVLIEGKKATDNITINPIPSNYGLITWDGSVLTVS